MPRGYPDYEASVEPAIALKTVWSDDFEAPVLKWVPNSSVGGTNPIPSSTQVWVGAQSIYFVTAAVAGEWAEIRQRFPLLQLGKVGIECFMLLSTFTPGYMRFRIDIFDGTNVTTAELHLDHQAQTATIITPLGPIVVATKCFNLGPERVFMPVKLVVDMDTDLYTRLLIGPQQIDLSTHSLANPIPSTDKLEEVSIRLVDVAGVGMWAYVDNFILTQNEP